MIHLSSYVDALRRGWSPDNLRSEAGQEELARIRQEPRSFIDQMDDPMGNGDPVKLPDGSFVPRLPGFRRWMWDGQFCGYIGLRWQTGTTDLPPYCPGHIGYAVVPWKQRQGYAKQALAQMLPQARDVGLPFVDLITDLDNTASQQVVLANGGVLIGTFSHSPSFGRQPSLRFRIALR